MSCKFAYELDSPEKTAPDISKPRASKPSQDPTTMTLKQLMRNSKLGAPLDEDVNCREAILSSSWQLQTPKGKRAQ